MLKIFIALFFILCASALAADNDSNNEVEPKPPIQLDPALRKALLKALENLEKEEEEATEAEESNTTEENEILATGDEVESRSKNKEINTDQGSSIQFHSFVVDGQKAFQNKTESNDNKAGESVTNKGLSPILVEDIETKESNFNSLPQTRSIQNNIVAENALKQSSKSDVVTRKPVTTTTTTTTTPKPKPKYNEDGENIEELEEEVQVFQAPLVAAFTVHQDALGQPRKVVPIYKQAVRKPITPTSPITLMRLNPSTTSTQYDSQLKGVSLNQNQDQIAQLTIQKQLEEKQRLLEEQLQKLQSQQRQHEELLRQQQYLQQQQQQILYAQREQQRQQLLHQEQQKIQQQYFEQQKASQNFVQPNQFQQQQFQKTSLSPTFVSFQPSISLPPIISVSEQQPPQKEAVDFLVHLRSGQQSPFPLQQNSLIPPSNQLQLPLDKPPVNFFDKSRQNINNVRVFRHDASTGNFGINSIYNRNQQPFNNFRNIPLSPHHNRYPNDNNLKSLLIQSGISQPGRSDEDLSIVSKVLSLNHGLNFRGNFLNGNYHFGESKRIETKIKPVFNQNS